MVCGEDVLGRIKEGVGKRVCLTKKSVLRKECVDAEVGVRWWTLEILDPVPKSECAKILRSHDLAFAVR